jgi:hypothetical protein
MSNSNSDDPEEMLKDDFEEVLRQNLNLRRELATEIGKVRVPKQGMHRLGVDSLLDLSNVSRRLGTDVPSTCPDR